VAVKLGRRATLDRFLRSIARDRPRRARSDHDGAFIIALFQQSLSAVCPSLLGCMPTDGWACICRCASWEFIGLPGLAPSACCAAVGWPCIWRCVSCDEAATSPLARFIVSVGGCCASVLMPVVWLLLCDAGPEPASLFVRPVSQGPAHAVPAPRTMTEQPARISRFMFMRVSSFLLSRAPTEQEVKETDAMVVGSGWQRVYLMGLPSGGPQFYESAIANGAIDEGAPGIRENYNANYCGAFFRDLDGNKIEAVTFTARETFE